MGLCSLQLPHVNILSKMDLLSEEQQNDIERFHSLRHHLIAAIWTQILVSSCRSALGQMPISKTSAPVAHQIHDIAASSLLITQAMSARDPRQQRLSEAIASLVCFFPDLSILSLTF